ncbi:MAG: CinA family nicotinamide mononucleotide deamidase-related protein [Muribaculaceae bacterium]|nr:CinA family nicotinamide mononucleotide deamidase-related protein [Muribaculaceae bacterium]
MKYSIIVIGDELLIGQVTDTNSGWIARHLTPWGWDVEWVKVIADDSREIGKAIDEAFAVTDVVLMTGGLGPTKDDITKPTLCRYFGGTLVHDEATARNVEWVVNQRHLTLNDYTRAQAMVPSSCRVIQNQVGTAPIMWFERDGKVLVSMPGVPFETETMMEREVIPQLLRHYNSHEHIAYRTFVVVGIIESLLAMRLDEFERSLPTTMHLAYLPQPGLIRLRLNGIMSDENELQAAMDFYSSRLHEILGGAIVSDDDKPLAQIVGERLRTRGLTLATAESCTGGNIAHQITAIAGCSDYYVGSVVSYDNQIKIRQLGVAADTIAAHGVVSEPVVRQMVEGVCGLLNTDCAVSTSGIAGPGGGTPTKPVGTVWMAAKCGDRVVSQMRHYPGTRDRVITRATTDVLLLLLSLLDGRDVTV